MSFYRIYRPQIIAEVDNPLVAEKLLSLLTKKASDLPHAYLFNGPKGTGKTTAARILAKIFNCQKPTKKGPCGKCDQCLAIANGTNLDVLEIDAASNRGIDEIRELRDRINLAPAAAKYKVYIIDEVHMLTTEAFNALLKTLEEPPRHAIFVLATTDLGKVPGTIKSRCVQVSFARAGETELLHALKRIVTKEKITIADEALTLLARTADGSFRDAVKMLEQVSFHRGKITPQVVQELLSLSEEKTVDLFIGYLSVQKAKEALQLVAELVEEGRDIRSFLTDCLGRLESLLIAHVEGRVDLTWTIDDLKEAIRRLSGAYSEMKLTAIPQLPLELAIIEFCQSRQTPPEKTVDAAATPQEISATESDGLLTIAKLTEHWSDFIQSMKPYNHSVAGVLRSARPKTVGRGIVTIEAFYKFHQEKLSEVKTREMLSEVLRKLFGEKVKVEIVLGKK